MSKLVTVKCDRCGEVLEGEKAKGAAVVRMTTDTASFGADLCEACVGYVRGHIDFTARKKPGKTKRAAA